MGKRYFFGLRGSKLRGAQLWAVIMPAYLLFGYNQAVLGGLLSLPSWIATFPQIDTTTTTGAVATANARIQGTVVGLYYVGCTFGALSCIDLGDRFGRIKMIQLGATVVIIGSIISSTSFSLAQLIVGQLITGLGFGALSATAPNWQGECSSASHRGAVVIMESLFISGGLALAGWINLGMSFTTGSVSWRFPLALRIFFATVTIIFAGMLPESPRWLMKVDRINDAREALAALEGLPEDHQTVESQMREISESLVATGKGRFIDCLANGELRLLNRTLLACAGQMFQQLSGINALAAYLSTIFSTYLGLNGVKSRIVAASVFTFQTVCSPIGVLTVDRFGRRKLMIVSAIGMGSCLAIFAGTASQAHSSAAVAVAGAMIFLFSLFFPVGFLGLTFLYATEISPLSVRVPITSLSTATAWVFNFMMTEVTPIGISTLTWKYFIVWAAINLFLTAPAVYFFFPETSGRHLEEVDQIFRDSRSFLAPVRIARQLPITTLLVADETVDEKDVHEETVEMREFS